VKKKVFLIGILIFNIALLYSQNNIYSILNKEIVIEDDWAGQSLTLVLEENNNYYVYRRIFGSGVAYTAIIKYRVIFNSEYKITISEIDTISENARGRYNNETITIYYRDELRIYLNGIRISIHQIR
jgi:hypothetical protein